MRKFLVALLALVPLILATGARAQQPVQATVVTVCGTPPSTYVAGTSRPLTQATNGEVCVTGTLTVSGTSTVTQGTTPWVVTSTQAGVSGAVTQTSISCGTTSTTLLAALAASNFIFVSVPTTATQAVWFRWDGGSASAATPSEQLGAGGSKTWIKQSGFLPTGQANCASGGSSAQTVTLEYN